MTPKRPQTVILSNLTGSRSKGEMKAEVTWRFQRVFKAWAGGGKPSKEPI